MGLGRDGKQHKGHTNKIALKETVYSYLAEPVESRLELKKWLRAHKMFQRTFYKLEGEYLAEKKGKEGIEEHKRELNGVVMDAWARLEGSEPPKRIKGITISGITEDEKIALARKVYQDAMRSDASSSAKDLAVRMLGMLIERKEIVKIDGAAIITAINEAERERRYQGNMEVSDKLSPLPPELRLDTGQSRARDS